jgi:DNA-binding NarL/FixJ family response regulator
MPIMNGLEATQKAIEIAPNIKILVLTMQASKEDYFSIVNAGAMGFVLKTAGKHELQAAINAILNGENFFSKDILQKVVTGFIQNSENGNPRNMPKVQLTEKEAEVLNYLCKGLSPSEIAQTIHRSVKTVEMHRSSLLEKTNTKNTINLILFAIKNKLVNLN